MTISPLAPVDARLSDRAVQIAAARDDLELAVRLMRRLRARLKELLVDAPELEAGDLAAVGATMPKDRLTADAKAQQQ